MSVLVLLDLFGGVALLLWGLHMVQSGILRAFGSDLRRILSKALRNRFAGFSAGLALTALLQSSTATGLMTASFAADGLVGLVPALAIMLGANVGTALIVQALSFNIAAFAPVLFVIGLLAFRSAAGPRVKNLGRVAIGLGLMLLALHILMDTLAPAEDVPKARAMLDMMTADPTVCVLIAAVLTWAVHSSVAMVLLIMSLAFSHFVSPVSAFALVLGANVGSAVNPLFEGGRRGDWASYRLPAGNLLNRLVGALLALPFLPLLADVARGFEPDAAKMTAEFHVAFNIALSVAFIGLLDPLAWLLVKALPARSPDPDPSLPRHLDESAIETPSLALANAAREVLHMGDLIEVMLRKVIDALIGNERALVGQISRMDDAVDRLDEAIRLYVAKLTRESLDDREGCRAMEIVSFAINLEHIGDIIDRNLCELAAKKIKRGLQFSEEGQAELTAFHKRVVDDLRLAFGVFMSADANGAQMLVANKTALRNAELDAAERHFERLREGRPETVETTSLHLDVLRDLKRIHSHVCSAAYPVLDHAGLKLHKHTESDPIVLHAKPTNSLTE